MGSAFQAYARNISLGGAFIETPYALAIDKRIELIFTIPDSEERIKVVGKVARNVPSGLGIQFIHAPERLVTAIESLPWSRISPRPGGAFVL